MVGKKGLIPVLGRYTGSWLASWRWYYHTEPWRSVWVRSGDKGEGQSKPRVCWDKGKMREAGHGSSVSASSIHQQDKKDSEDLLPKSSASAHPSPSCKNHSAGLFETNLPILQISPWLHFPWPRTVPCHECGPRDPEGTTVMKSLA